MCPKREWIVVLSLGLALLGVSLLLVSLGAPLARAQDASNPRPITTDGRSRFAGWSPDGRTLLVNRWGTVVGEGAVRQTLSELWAVDIRGEEPELLSENAVRPAYSEDGERLAYLAYAEGGRWEIRVLGLRAGREEVWAEADWGVSPAWVDGKLPLARDGRLWQSDESGRATFAGVPDLPVDGQITSFAWSPDGRWLAYVVAADDLAPALWVADALEEEAPALLVQGQMEVFSDPSWSPDGRSMAFSRTPLGAGTASASDIWLVDANGQNLRPLLQNDLEESHPAWSPDGRHIAFNRAGDVWLLDLNQPFKHAPLPSPNPSLPRSPAVQQTPPLTIRVVHDEINTCRHVPLGRIDVLGFEDYVKRVVPAEVWASWPGETLKAQAVAARTYGWRYVLHPANENYDVTDSARYQNMCDETYTATNAAVDATRGQYVAYQGDIIVAFYSAENGSPTRDAAGYPYIEAVEDPVSFGQERRGHGWGMSQWGAYRWAAWHGWGYQQILAHYYTGVTIELPSTGGPLPLAGITLPWSDYYVTANQVYIAVNASDEESDVQAVEVRGIAEVVTDSAGLPITGTVVLPITGTTGDDGWGIVWDVTALSDTTTSTAIALSVWVTDGAGLVQTETHTVTIGLDRQPPTETMAAIHGIYTSALTVTLSGLSATDPSPGSGVESMAFGDEEWAWEGEDLYHVLGTGEVITDENALNGQAWRGLAGVHSPGAWFGPYTYVLPPGYAYRAYYRLKTNGVTNTAEIATLDVVDNGGERSLGLRRLRGTDFRVADAYQEFPVDFSYPETGTMGLEFRVAFRATGDLYLDRVLVVGYPVDFAPGVSWRLSPGEGNKTITIKFIDGAGNVSADLTRTIILDAEPPTDWQDFEPEQWDGGPPPTCTVRVRDAVSGLDVNSARYRFSTDGGVAWSEWTTATCTGISGTTEVQTITAQAVPFGLPRTPSNRIQFRIADTAGFSSTVIYTVRGPLSIIGPATGSIRIPYVFTAGVRPLTGTLALPITYTWQTTDQDRVARRRDGLTDTVVFTWNMPGSNTVLVTATNAGGDVGRAEQRIAITAPVYLPLMMRDWQVGTLVPLP
jgi:hypothetical protein